VQFLAQLYALILPCVNHAYGIDWHCNYHWKKSTFVAKLNSPHHDQIRRGKILKSIKKIDLSLSKQIFHHLVKVKAKIKSECNWSQRLARPVWVDFKTAGQKMLDRTAPTTQIIGKLRYLIAVSNPQSGFYFHPSIHLGTQTNGASVLSMPFILLCIVQ
jgi:hypothetical protein